MWRLLNSPQKRKGSRQSSASRPARAAGLPPGDRPRPAGRGPGQRSENKSSAEKCRNEINGVLHA